MFAHELTHVFNLVKVVVPAFMDWKNFWKICLDQGFVNDLVGSDLSFCDEILDRYATDSELKSVQAYWPSKAGVWFDVFNGVICEQNDCDVV